LSAVLSIEDRDTALHYIGYLYASDAEGRLFRAVQRRYFNTVVGRGTGSWQLEWADISWDDYRIFSGGVIGGQTSPKRIFFADADGRLLERTVLTPAIVERSQLVAAYTNQMKGSPNISNVADRVSSSDIISGGGNGGYRGAAREQQHHLWKSHGSPPGSGIALVGAAMHHNPFSVFAITVDGRLAEWCPSRVPTGLDSRNGGRDTGARAKPWTIHPRPRSGVRLSLLPSTLVLQSIIRSFDESRTEIALLVTGEDGSVWARQGHQRKYRWERQRRAPSHVLSAPSNTIVQPHTVSTFFVGKDGSLMERRFRASSSRWLWTDYGFPEGLPLTLARPVVLSASEVLCQTVIGATASLTKWNGKWSWVTHKGPELAARPEDFSADGGTHEERASKAMMLEGDALPSAEIEQKWVGSENGKFEESWRDGGTNWFSSMHDSRRHAFRATHSMMNHKHAKRLENRFETTNVTQGQLCAFESNSMYTCGIRRDPLAFFNLPPHMINEDGLKSLGVQVNSFSHEELKIAMVHEQLFSYVDAHDMVNHHQINGPRDEAERVLKELQVKQGLKQVGLPADTVTREPGPSIFHDGKSRFVENTTRSRILPPAINLTLGVLPEGSHGEGRWPLPVSSSYYMGELLATSVFSLSPGGAVFERFYNGAKWVYVRHELPGPRRLISVTTVASHGTIFVSDVRGQLFQRISPGLDRPLAWKRVLIGHSVEVGGVTGTESTHGVRVFFVNHVHEIVTYSVHRRNWTLYEGNGDELIECESNEGELWISDEIEGNGLDGDPGVQRKRLNGDDNEYNDDTDVNDNDDDDESAITAQPTVIIDAFSLLTGSIFAIDSLGHLIEHARSENLWINHGHPAEGVPLSLGRGVVVRDVHPNRVGSIFLRGADGNLYERWWDASVGGWRWMEHGSPKHTFVASAPGALHESRELYVVGGDAHLWARAYLDDSWQWVDRGQPSAPLSLVSPIKVGGDSIMVVLLDGKLASIKADARIKLHTLGWEEFEGPEPVKKGAPPLAMYCSDDPRSQWNCIQAGSVSGGSELPQFGKLKKKAARVAASAINQATSTTGTSVMQLPLGSFGVMLQDYSFFYDNAGNLDIGGDRSRESSGAKQGRKKRRRKLPSDWLKLNDDEDLQTRSRVEQTSWGWLADMRVSIIIAAAIAYCLHMGRIPVVNIRLPIRVGLDLFKCKCMIVNQGRTKRS
jgi:hypothetical protein